MGAPVTERNNAGSCGGISMAKGLNVTLAVSLLLNVGLVVGFLSYRNFVRSHVTEGAISMAQGEASLLRSILADLESNDPQKTEALKERLKQHISTAETAASAFHQAAQ
jgi:hypothetical protein